MSMYGLAMGTPTSSPEDPWLACRYEITDHPLYFECFYCPHNTYCDIFVGYLQQFYIQLMKEGRERDKDVLNQLPEYWKYVFAGHIKHHLFPDIPYLDIDGIEEPSEIDEIIERAKENLRQNGFDVSNY